MRITIFPKWELEQKWAEDRKHFSVEAENPPVCLRCGKPLAKHLSDNALSRYADVMVCDCCGSDEAMRDFGGAPLPLREWRAAKDGRLDSMHTEGQVPVKPDCAFSDIFRGPKKNVPYTGLPVPESKLVHSRSDYDGRKWWTTWHPCHSGRLPGEIVREIDEFQDSLMALSEFKDLSALQELCRRYASPTSDPTEFNLYAQTIYLNIWVRLITRFKDYNLYVNFYKK